MMCEIGLNVKAVPPILAHSDVTLPLDASVKVTNDLKIKTLSKINGFQNKCWGRLLEQRRTTPNIF